MDVEVSTTHLLHGMRLVNRRTGEHTGPCPHCQAGTNRYHVWTEIGAGGRPAWRYWWRSCGASGVIKAASHDHAPAPERPISSLPRPADPCAAHIPFYRQLYELRALWAHGWLMDGANPDPLAYLAKRGVNQTTAVQHMLGYVLHHPQALVVFLTEHAPDLMPYAQEAGLLVVDRQGILRTHWNLCGALIFPTIAEGEVIDLRARKLERYAKARSLVGSPRDRGAIYPFGWDSIGDTDTVMLTESGEFKTLVLLAAYPAGDLSAPTIGCPGINGMPPTLGTALAHDLRHSRATFLIAQGEHPRVVMEILGHAQMSTTIDIYGHVLPRTQRRQQPSWMRCLGRQPIAISRRSRILGSLNLLRMPAFSFTRCCITRSTSSSASESSGHPALPTPPYATVSGSLPSFSI
jgi:hypothetical protein